ncbi:MAG: glycoside hydrolase family 95-like protein [Mangrovibacterium sp.]
MKISRTIILLILQVSLFSCYQENNENRIAHGNLVFQTLAPVWDEAIPLGNGMLGALIWQKDSNLRFSLDRADLWDLRPMDNLSRPEFSYRWVQEQLEKNNYKAVQDLFDAPYDQMPAPSKIPGAALEFDISSLGKIKSVKLDLVSALCIVDWESKAKLETFVQADRQSGWFKFTNIQQNLTPVVIPPAYGNRKDSVPGNPVDGQDLQRLGYEQGKVVTTPGKQVYRQRGWNGFEYEVAVTWKSTGNTLTGVWSISSSFSEKTDRKTAGSLVTSLLHGTGFEESFDAHCAWWKKFWSKSSVSLPDPVLEKQYYLECYKFGSVARPDAPPISLQAVWTADNGKLPPWKGDFHHDLNTQLSYWPAYAGNYLDLETGFIDWLWKYRDTFQKYTKTYFGTDGLNVPGVTTLTGEPMGGWIQYSLGPTVAAWLAHHFYLHWIYSRDQVFLKEKAYPWLRDVARYLDGISVKNQNGKRKLPISSSPEIFDNSAKAWFHETTNFDLALIRWTFEKASELAGELDETNDSLQWQAILNEWPEFALDSTGGLAFAPDYDYMESHRHFSHLVAWHPLGLIDWSDSEKDREIIRATLATLEQKGSAMWTGYSFSWLGNLYARAFMGEKAAETLRIFAENFTLPNSFHVNGEQHDRGYSNFKYRPFTLEGNFAFAAAIQEMLIQSHTGVVHIFPAIPPSWKDVSFHSLRTAGAFLVSASQVDGKVQRVIITSEKGGLCKLKNPFGTTGFKLRSDDKDPVVQEGDLLIIHLLPESTVELYL